MDAPNSGPVKLDLIWGAPNIGRVINRTTRQTSYYLEAGDIPAQKVGTLWVCERGQLLKFFLNTK